MMRASLQHSARLGPALLATLLVVGTSYLASAQEATKNFIMHPTPKPVAAISFVDDQGQTRSLADFKGKIVVLNIWATWCVPCRKEMSSLDRLQTALGSPDFAVVPISIDRGGMSIVSKFYSDTGIVRLAKFIDTTGQIVRAVGVLGLPATLIIDRTGNEAGRVLGPAEWDAPEIIGLLKTLIAKKPSG